MKKYNIETWDFNNGGKETFRTKAEAKARLAHIVWGLK